MKKVRLEFSNVVKRKAKERAKNRCERCGVDFDSDFKGEYHHIVPVYLGGTNNLDNCTLLCHNCHSIAPNVKEKYDLVTYNYFFLKFASYKESFNYYGVDNRFDMYIKFSLEIAQSEEKMKEIERQWSAIWKF
jgi:hypothetical protein